MSEKLDLQGIISEETEKRLAKMQSSDYVFPKKMGKADYIGIIAGCAASAILIVLCICGVIQ